MRSRRVWMAGLIVGLITVMLAINIGIIIMLLVIGVPAEIGYSVTHGVVIGVVELLLVLGVGWLGLKQSHAIVGPVWVLERDMARVADGDLTIHMTVRSRDRFQSISENFNTMTDALRERIDGIKGDLQQLALHADASPEIASIVKGLKEKIDHFKTVADTPEETGNGD